MRLQASGSMGYQLVFTLGFTMILVMEWWSWSNVQLQGSNIVINLLTSVFYSTVPLAKKKKKGGAVSSGELQGSEGLRYLLACHSSSKSLSLKMCYGSCAI